MVWKAHEWNVGFGKTAAVAYSGADLGAPGLVQISIPEEPLRSERLAMALEILRLGETVAQRDRLVADLYQRVNSLEADRCSADKYIATLEHSEISLKTQVAALEEASVEPEEESVPVCRKCWKEECRCDSPSLPTFDASVPDLSGLAGAKIWEAMSTEQRREAINGLPIAEILPYRSARAIWEAMTPSQRTLLGFPGIVRPQPRPPVAPSSAG